MESGIRVGDIMTRNFVFESPGTDLRTCAKKMVKKRVGSLIIKEKDKLLGILTEKDIIWAVVKKNEKVLKDIKASDLMKRKVVTIKPSEDILDAVKRFRKKKVRRMPVVEHGKVIGMITQKDILKIDPGLFELIAQTIKIKEETKKTRHKTSGRGYGICEECGDYNLLTNEAGQSICESCFEKR